MTTFPPYILHLDADVCKNHYLCDRKSMTSRISNWGFARREGTKPRGWGSQWKKYENK